MILLPLTFNFIYGTSMSKVWRTFQTLLFRTSLGLGVWFGSWNLESGLIIIFVKAGCIVSTDTGHGRRNWSVHFSQKVSKAVKIDMFVKCFWISHAIKCQLALQLLQHTKLQVTWIFWVKDFWMKARCLKYSP